MPLGQDPTPPGVQEERAAATRATGTGDPPAWEPPAAASPVPTSQQPTVATRRLVLAGLLAALTGVLAYLRIPLPFTPVPTTGQTLGVMLSGLLLGPAWGALAQLVYVVVGTVGVPVFAGGQAGPAVLLGPTGGYLVSFPLAAGVIGWIAGTRWMEADSGQPMRIPGFGRALLAALVGGVFVVYAVGAPWFAIHQGRAWQAVWAGAVLPFIPGDLAKAVLAAWLAPALGRALGRR